MVTFSELRSELAIAVRERDQENEALRAWLTGDLYVPRAQYDRGIPERRQSSARNCPNT